jgi:hypothetical protein
VGMRLRVWIRDLTDEGIEPHPGPRYITKNINEGMAIFIFWPKRARARSR